MNTWQNLRQIKKILSERRWDDNAGNDLVFGSVVVTAIPGDNADGHLIRPFVLVKPLNSVADDEEPGLITQTFECLLVSAAEGDALGENALIGANTLNRTTSPGRGLLEIEEELKQTIRKLTQVNGIALIVRKVGSVAGGQIRGSGAYTAMRNFTFDLYCTDDKFYHPPPRLTAVDAAGGGNADLTWLLPPTRYDFDPIGNLGGLVLRRSAGATPPADPTSGTGVAIGNFDTSVTDSPGAGQFSYALFAGFDETGSGSNDFFSTAATATVTVT